MAKKVVASLQSDVKKHSKVIKMFKNSKTGSYSFKETIMRREDVEEFLKNKEE